MPIAAEIRTKAFERQMKKFQKEFPFAISKAMELTVKEARDKVRKEMDREFDRARKTTISAVRAQWPKKAQVRGGQAVAKVFTIPALVNAIHTQAYGDRIGLTPDGAGFVVTPVNIKLNENTGNIPGLRSRTGIGILSRMRNNPKKFLEVKIGDTNPRTSHLEPGIYQKISNSASRIAPSRRRINGRRRRRGSRFKVQNLLMMVAYEPYRQYKERIEYHETIERCFDRLFQKQLRRLVFRDVLSRR